MRSMSSWSSGSSASAPRKRQAVTASKTRKSGGTRGRPSENAISQRPPSLALHSYILIFGVDLRRQILALAPMFALKHAPKNKLYAIYRRNPQIVFLDRSSVVNSCCACKKAKKAHQRLQTSIHSFHVCEDFCAHESSPARM